jgi:hypothetical protein
MGEVYRARDTRLERDVAIKVLPSSFAADPERRARFEREAKSVAALSHPNIIAIYDTGLHETQLFVVTELLQGETLRDALRSGALPARKGIDIGVQIARGLAAAHDRGLVHRDLKPENVFVLADGRVKILDFGLAKSVATDTTAGAMTATAVAATDPGTVMGTVGYMAPEQVRGQATDPRTDLFALGALLYEIFTGKRAFQRDTAAETMTAILREDPPDLALSRADLPPALDRIVRHCLEKNPAERFQTARDVAFALEAFSGTTVTSGSAQAVPVPTPRRSPGGLAAGALVLALASLAAGYGLRAMLRPATAGAPPVTFDWRTWDPQWITNLRFAPDGQTIVYSAAPSGNVPSLFALRQGAFVAQPLGQPGTHLLSISKSGELAVLTNVSLIGHRLFNGTLTRMSIDGAARPWMEHVREADWSPDGSTMAIVRDLETKDRLEYPIDKVLYEVSSGYLSDPRVSPDGTRVAFLEHSTRYDDRGFLKVVDRSGAVRTLAGEFWGAEGVAWSPDSAEVFVSVSVAGSFGYAPQKVNADGTPVLRPAFPSIVSAETMDIAASGQLLVNLNEQRLSMRVLLPGESAERELPWLDLPLARNLSDDGKWLLFGDEAQSAGLNYAVALRRTDGSPAVRLGEGGALALSGDAKWALASVLSPPPARYVVYPTGAGSPIPLDFKPIADISNLDWMPDHRIFFCGTEPGQPRRCYVKKTSGGPATPVTAGGISFGSPAPDGHTILTRTPEGALQVNDVAGGPARPVPGPTRIEFRELVGWSRDSRAVFIYASNVLPAPIDRLDLATGARSRVRELMPPDRSGVMMIVPGRVTDNAYSYSYWRQVTRAVIVSGAVKSK